MQDEYESQNFWNGNTNNNMRFKACKEYKNALKLNTARLLRRLYD